MRLIKYNSNIDIVDVVSNRQSLHPSIPTRELQQDYEFFALMVTDSQNKNTRPKTDYFLHAKDWIGLEQTSDNRIYISKNFNKRYDGFRGETVIVSVIDKSLCCILS
jgi:hypothetical protein